MIEKELFGDNVGLSDRVATLESRLDDAENTVIECQRDLSQELDLLVAEKLAELKVEADKKARTLTSSVTADKNTLVSLSGHLGPLGKDVVELAGEIADQIRETASVRQENVALRGELEEARKMIVEV